MLNKKGQIGETITWTVATIVIIVILIVGVVISSASGKSSKEVNVIDEKRDFLMTKSFVNFLTQDNNFDIIKEAVKEEKYENFETKFKPFLESLSTEKEDVEKERGWNIQLVVDNKEKFNIITSRSRDVNQNSFFDMNFLFDSNKVKLIFWEECFEKCY